MRRCVHLIKSLRTWYCQLLQYVLLTDPHTEEASSSAPDDLRRAESRYCHERHPGDEQETGWGWHYFCVVGRTSPQISTSLYWSQSLDLYCRQPEQKPYGLISPHQSPGRNMNSCESTTSVRQTRRCWYRFLDITSFTLVPFSLSWLSMLFSHFVLGLPRSLVPFTL